MLKRWHLQNFKSFKEVPPIELSAINVLAGANSSGKSSLIQSILLLKQTLQYGPEERAVTLNGPLVRLGSFEDVRNYSATGESLSIGCEFSDDEGLQRPSWAKSYYSFGRSQDISWRTIALSIAFKSDYQRNLPQLFEEPGDLNPTLLGIKLALTGTTANTETVNREIEFKHSPGNWLYSVNADPLTAAEIINDRPQGYIEGGLTEHFLPNLTIVNFNQTLVHITELVDNLFRWSDTLLTRAALSDEPLSPKVVAIIDSWLIENGAPPISTGHESVLASVVRARIAPIIRPQGVLQLAGRLPHEKVSDVAAVKERISSALIMELPIKKDRVGARSEGMNYAIAYLSDFFKFGVRYLGPLRDSPRPVYQPEALESTTDVGYRGEHTAAVFDINKTNRVKYVKPPTAKTERDFMGLAERAEDRLSVAVAAWLEYLGVASSVETTDMGVFGNRLRVAVQDGAPLHDLTNVGVGVSQVLPIVVMALLAPTGSLLIFEQPELHLHPKVQARLADFFLALAMDNKQTILETHSEYLVDRFRLRIAMSPSDTVRPLVNILFSEKNGGETSIVPVQISEFGAITNWPADFFEQSQQDVGRIVQAASQKRRSRGK